MANEKIIPVNIEQEMQNSYLDYSMSVIVARALPDVRDGLKPVHRRVLYGMNELGLQPNRPYKKSARVVGDVLGKYHPHGDKAVYDTIVRMVQDFSLRYPLVDGQGNFGSVDGDSPAAMRYTEVRLAQISNSMLADLEKNTVDFVANYDDTAKEPSVLPTILPGLLVNGSSGIAVGMATNIPPHNLTEVVDGLIALIKEPAITIDKIMKHVKAPDFPTGGIIWGFEGVKSAYHTGRGKIIIRAKARIEVAKNDRETIIISELPYQVNKANLIENIAYLVRDKKIEDISDVRDESDKDGLRVVIDVKRGGAANVILNNLFKHTQMQVTFGVILLALVDGIPRVLNLKDMMESFVKHRLNVIIRRTKFDLDAAEKRAHILEGYMIALDNIDEVIEVIKKSKDVPTAQERLMKRFKLSEIQSKAILEMRLQRLTGLERKKIEEEYRELIKLIEKLKRILASDALRREILTDELKQLKETYGDERRTEIVMNAVKISDEEFIKEFIKEEDVVITISHSGYIKRTPVSGYRRQSRGGKGIIGATTREDDFIEHMFVASTHNHLMFFTDLGKCYMLKVHEIQEASRTAKGYSVANYLGKSKEEEITAILNVKDFGEEHYITMVTKQGVMKKTDLNNFENTRKGGIIAISLGKDDKLIDVQLTNGKQEILIGTHGGMAIRFNESDIRSMGRTAAGVRAIKLDKKDYVVGLVAVKRAGTSILVVTDKGYGKRSDLQDYRMTRRGGKGVITMKSSEKNGSLISIREVVDNDDLMIITTKGIMIRQNVGEIRVMGRNTQGVRLIKLHDNDTISAVASVVGDDAEVE
ncbi:MAG TPA: DNA gyrase subunit A [Ignavibacteria bacterium]|nr:DNA gyrase subunit A [Ignavibacteria bacterium]HRF65793.1 DNA gyrase subunit A [Ignavibacteria bacterium]HRJ03245.1 DNA gyrase subunit A [Ignavibacteria bacterium]